MSRGFKRSDGLMVFTDYDATNPHFRKSLVIDSKGREMVVSIPRENTLSPEKAIEIGQNLIVDDDFPLSKLFHFEEVGS